MKCPICQYEMEEGGLLIDGLQAAWVPMEQFLKKGLKRLTYRGLRTFGKTNFLLRQTRASGAFYCKTCNKIVGIFDVTNGENIDSL